MIQSGILTEQGHSIAFVDAIALGLSGDACIHRIQAFAPDAIVGLAADVSWLEDIRFYRSLSQLKPAPRLFLSGDVPRFEAKRSFEALPGLEAIITDFTTDGVARLLSGEDQAEGLILRDGTQLPSTVRQWTSPPARHDLITRHAYRLPFHGGEAFASVLSSYGCPFSCTFCNTGELSFKTRAACEVVEELQLVRDLGFRRVYMRDATANGHRAHWLDVCQQIAAADLDLRWNVFCTFRPFDAELANAMAAAGCDVVQFGIETASESLRAETGKAFDNEAAYAAVRYAHEAGIKVCGHFVLGLPTQSEEDVRATGEFARALDLDYASFNLASARPGTGLRDTADAAGLSGGDASIDGFIEGLSEVPSQRLRFLRREAILRFYLRPRPLRAMFPNLMQRSGWAHLASTVRAVSQSF